MNMNYSQMPYELDYAEEKMMSPGGQASRASVPIINMPQMPQMGQQQLPMAAMGQLSMPMTYAMTGNMMQQPQQLQHPQTQPQPMSMMPAGGMSQFGGHMTTALPQVSMPTMTQLPPGAVTPLSSTTMMPVMGGIDASGLNVVVPDLQPMSSMSQLGTNMPQVPQMNQVNRLAGGSGDDMNYVGSGGGGGATSGNQMMSGNMWNYGQSAAYPQMQYMPEQPSQSQQRQYAQQQQPHHLQQQQHHHYYQNQHHHHQPQQRQHYQQHPQQQSLKSSYGYSNNSQSYRDMRNGLNSPSTHRMKYSRNSGESTGKKIHWR